DRGHPGTLRSGRVPADRPRRHRGGRPGRGHVLVRGDLRAAQRARGGQRGAGRPGGHARRRRRHHPDPAARAAAAGLGDREVPGPQRARRAAGGVHGRGRGGGGGRAAGQGPAAAVRAAPPRHRRLAGQLRAPQGRRRGPGRAGGAGPL
ncbi:MAG: Methylmalonyl-CoA epimerase @ Ethylmalonyl-CoA epimerase, partial [uncultured Corynebacteriales bacterium]